MKSTPAKRKWPWIAAGIISVIMLAGLLFVRRRKRPKKVSAGRKSMELGGAPPGMQGLTEAEAAARQPDYDLDEEIKREQGIFLRRAVRESILNTFNIDLFGIAVIMLLLDNPGGALGTALILILNLVINVFQEMFTKKRLDQILVELRPQATVIREGKLRSLDPALIVDGDLLVAVHGDEILVDGEVVSQGEMVVEESTVELEPRRTRVGPGKAVRAGDFCAEGRGVYRASENGIDRHRAAPGSRLQLLMGEKTSLQRFMEVILRTLFAMVVVFSILLVADALIADAVLVSREYRDAFSIIFGIAPTSLFFILIITYAVGTFRISERGALVYSSQTIEALANIHTLCISKESLVSGVQVDLEPVDPAAGDEPLSESLIRRVLGDILNSAPVTTDLGRMLAQALPGERYPFKQAAPYLFEHGWYGISFDEPDLRGTFVLGLPDVLEEHLERGVEEFIEEVENRLTRAQRDVGRWWKRISRRAAGGGGRGDRAEEDLANTENAAQSTQPATPAKEDSPDWRQRMRSGLERLLSPMEDIPELEREAEDEARDIRLLFAYLPEVHPLRGQAGKPQLPKALIPLSELHISEAVRMEAGETIQSLVEAGMQAKLLSSDTPERSAATVRQLGLLGGELTTASGEDLEGLPAGEFKEAVRAATVIGDLTPAQKAAVVRALREESRAVLMVGSRISDVPALREADLRVALRSSAQAAMRLTDIVLLKDSLAALPHVLTTGQRMVNGVLDVFKLYLSQVISQLLLIVAMIVLRLEEFPYHPTQAGVITAFTIAIPNAFLSVWAASGRVTEAVIRRRLARFIIPAAVMVALLSLGAYGLFLGRTGDIKYTQLGVTFTLLIAGWLRVFFVQPPTRFWVGGAPLRGDRRVIGLVLACIALFAVIITVPLFGQLLHTTWLPEALDYVLAGAAALVWALALRAIWRSGLLEPLFERLAGRGGGTQS